MPEAYHLHQQKPIGWEIQMEDDKRQSPPVLALGPLVLAICCGGPLLVAALAAAGLGTGLLATGWPVAGAALIAVGLLGFAFWRRRHD